MVAGATPAFTEQERSIIEEVERHYRDSATPYYLSGLGEFIRSHGIEVPAGIRLKDFLSSTFQGSLLIVQNENIPAKIAIATPEQEERVTQMLGSPSSPEHADSDVDFGRLPFALIAAFCIASDLGNRVFFRTLRPLRYVIRQSPPDHTHVEVDPEFRPSHADTPSAHNLSEADKQAIYQRIVDWAESKRLDLKSFYYDVRPERTGRTTNATSSSTNALLRLVEAQELSLQSRIRIPGDIAVALTKLP